VPTYSYRCTACGNAFDIQQSMSDSSLTECPACGGALRKVFSPIGVTFNGSGFYRTDSRKSGSSTKSGGSSASSGSVSSGGSSSSSSTASSGSGSASSSSAGSSSGSASSSGGK
jgi:putative FmdB family regulatory protein